jgi:hypothetical protein
LAAASLAAVCIAGFNGARLYGQQADKWVPATRISLDGQWHVALETDLQTRHAIEVPGTIEDQVADPLSNTRRVLK